MSQESDIWAVILAAGSGSRLASAGLIRPKQYLNVGGVPLFWHSVRVLALISRLCGMVLVFPAADLEVMQIRVSELAAADDLSLVWKAVAGGQRRQDSVRRGLAVIPRECKFVLIHDAARPFVSAELVQRLLIALDKGERAVVPICSVKDTVKRVDNGRVLETVERSQLALVQTPQAFSRDILEEAYARPYVGEAIDDAILVEKFCSVAVVPGEEGNVKITVPEDLALLRDKVETWPCVGYGYDVHRYGDGRPMVLGGVLIPNAPRVMAHSDGDVLLHALADAVLGCFGGGDIGLHFPDIDPVWYKVNSEVLFQRVLIKAQAAGLRLVQADLTIIAQEPKVTPYRDKILANVARLLKLERSRVNIKATTEEGLGFTGEKKGIKAVALVMALRSFM